MIGQLGQSTMSRRDGCAHLDLLASSPWAAWPTTSLITRSGHPQGSVPCQGLPGTKDSCADSQHKQETQFTEVGQTWALPLIG